MTWWSIDLFLSESSPDVSFCAAEAIDNGAEGATELSDTSFRIYCNGGEEVAENLIRALEHLQVKAEKPLKVEERNWVAESSELLTPVVAGALHIIPVTTEEIPTQQAPLELRLLAGTGFGTGHHPTTASCLHLLQHPDVVKSAPKTALDFGTGSGILAIATVKLHGSDVVAIDNDPLALENAASNVAINGSSATITLTQKLSDDTYELLIANVYAEVLCEYEDYMHKALLPNRFIILSGIMAEKKQDVLNTFQHPRWELREEIEERGWVSLLLERRT